MPVETIVFGCALAACAIYAWRCGSGSELETAFVLVLAWAFTIVGQFVTGMLDPYKFFLFVDCGLLAILAAAMSRRWQFVPMGFFASMISVHSWYWIFGSLPLPAITQAGAYLDWLTLLSYGAIASVFGGTWLNQRDAHGNRSRLADYFLASFNLASFVGHRVRGGKVS